MKQLSHLRPEKFRQLGQLALLTCGLLFIVAACSANGGEAVATPTTGPTVAPTLSSTEPTRGQVVVDSIDVLILESFPVQVNVVARGNLPDSCTQVDEIITQQANDTFRVAITTLRQPALACTQALVPFEQTLSLDVVGLPAGTYTVNVNGVQDTFTLAVDNVAVDDTTTGAGAAVTETPGIRGFVWHDVCSQTGAAVGEVEAENGCIPSSTGDTLQANGVMDAGEPGIPGINVRLLAGDCTTATEGDEVVATTDESGAYRFEDITPDTYCVFLDTADEENLAILEEGILTAPVSNGVGTNSVTVEMAESAALDDINFGFDFLFLPVPEVAEDCTNSFEFVQDLTVPDNTVFPPGAEFEAAWRLRNNGTCPWTEEYAVAFVGGDPMGITSTVTLDTTVAPGQTEDVSITLTAPEEPGTYRSNWQLSDAAGTVFGINGAIEDAFWVQIVVEEGAEFTGPPATGSSVIGGVVWEDVCFLTNGNPSRGCVETEEGSGFYRGNGSFDAGEAPLPGITLKLGRGACPDGGVLSPANQLATTISDEEGLYRFEGLDADIYCVVIDALSPENVDLLIPGNWTWPAPGTGRLGIRLAAGEERLTVDFGWDFAE
ncbi:MAG: NBR1-Ig-like domain-containing protein [Chloroflexota bacterium]